MARARTSPRARRREAFRVEATRRQEERVTPLELFFDLVFVLAITQCTALMASDPTWHGLAKGVLVLGVLWWSWVGYAWLTSVVDPEAGGVRIVMFAAMAGLLVVSLCVPRAFDELGLTFAVAYGLVRVAHIALFVLASREDPQLRHSVVGLGIGTAIGVGLLTVASFLHGTAQGGLWLLALLLDMAEPFFFGAEGWELVPAHFAERHGLIIIIALGESIVAIGVAAQHGLTAGVVVGAFLGTCLLAGMWWAYFDVVAYVSSRHLSAAPEGKARNELARDLYSYLHFPMVAGIVLVALGLKTTLADVGAPLASVPAFALVGGLSVYLLGHVAFQVRDERALNAGRLVMALLLLALVPLGPRLPAVVSLGGVAVLLAVLIAYETIRFADVRNDVRRHLGEPASA